jgi:hypothetical protein
VRVPTLALLGGKDTQVTAAQNEPALKVALRGNPRAEVRTLPDLNRLFQKAATGAVSEYRSIDETIAPAALKAISDGINDSDAPKSLLASLETTLMRAMNGSFRRD